ncbi:hypothetical protein [Streptomyces xanthophaeus]|uniref:hypothetical protein n=1 Tax=Streptomyces xanthophaeus TaxID=67385 RepID=UPI000690CD6F|nr:hypothetical protein [Streptomyces xanthophaeus]
MKHTTRFVVVGNHLAQHPSMSLVAIGLATPIQSLPAGTRIGIKRLAERFPEGEVRIAAALRELEAYGYLERVRVRLETGQVVTRTVSYNRPRGTSPEDPPPNPTPPKPTAPAPAPQPLPDAGPRPDPGPELGPELEPEPGRVPGSTLGFQSVPVPVPEPAAMPVPVPEAMPVPVTAAMPVPVPEAMPVPEPAAMPVPVPEPEAMPVPEPAAMPVPVPVPVAMPELGAGRGPGPARVGPSGSGPGPWPVAGRPPGEPAQQDAFDLLARLRLDDPRLLLPHRAVHQLAPGVAEWLDRGAGTEAVRHFLGGNLPPDLRNPAALIAYRLRAQVPPHLPAAPAAVPVVRPHPFQTCDGCERAFRAPAPGRCGDCPPGPSAAAA